MAHANHQLGPVRTRSRVVLTALVAVAVTLGGLLVGNAVSSAAPAQICDQFGSAPVAGAKYVVQNDRWGAQTEQCITPFDTGFSVDKAEHTNNAGPAGYPSIYRGCVYGYCTAASPFPVQVSAIGSVRSVWSTSGPTAGGTQQYNTAYDIWFDPNPNQAGRNTGAELMIWLNRTSWVQPIGKPVRDVAIGGALWTMWYGTIDVPVVSYVRKTPVTSVGGLAIDQFVRDASRRGIVNPAWYLTSVQAGFEPWTGGTGLRTNSFSVTRNNA